MDLQGSFHVYDTTLRDGAQQEGLNLSVADKLTIARQLDGLGVGYIEGGWPGANPKDEEFFRRAATELRLTTSTLVAFGSTRRASKAASVPFASTSAVHPCFAHIASHIGPRLFCSSQSTMYRSVNICVFDAISCGSILSPSAIFLSSASRSGSFQYW